jgi:hypothetical protein
VVTFLNVRQFGYADTNSFQIEMFFDGTIRITCLRIDATDGLIGLSAGQGIPAGFTESDFSSYALCLPPDALAVTPGPGLVSQGYEGGPFTPASTTYTLSNVSTNALIWSAAATQPWLNLSATSGSLAPATVANVTVSFNAQANLPRPAACLCTCWPSPAKLPSWIRCRRPPTGKCRLACSLREHHEPSTSR